MGKSIQFEVSLTETPGHLEVFAFGVLGAYPYAENVKFSFSRYHGRWTFEPLDVHTESGAALKIAERMLRAIDKAVGPGTGRDDPRVVLAALGRIGTYVVRDARISEYLPPAKVEPGKEYRIQLGGHQLYGVLATSEEVALQKLSAKVGVKIAELSDYDVLTDRQRGRRDQLIAWLQAPQIAICDLEAPDTRSIQEKIDAAEAAPDEAETQA